MADYDIRRELLEGLEYQRASVRSIVEGLAEEAWHRPVVPSGWTVAGMVEHLGNAERHWFQEVVAAEYPDLPWDEGRPPYNPTMAFTCDRPSSEVLGYYQEQCDRADEILAGLSLSDVPRGRHRGEEIPSVSVVILHIIEETAAHTGHLEIAREFLDGATGLGLRLRALRSEGHQGCAMSARTVPSPAPGRGPGATRPGLADGRDLAPVSVPAPGTARDQQRTRLCPRRVCGPRIGRVRGVDERWTNQRPFPAWDPKPSHRPSRLLANKNAALREQGPTRGRGWRRRFQTLPSQEAPS